MKENPSNPNQKPEQAPEQAPSMVTIDQHKKEINKRKRTTKAALLLVLTIVLIIAGYIAYSMLMKQDTPDDTAVNTSTSPADAAVKSAATIMKETRAYADSTVKESYPKLVTTSPEDGTRLIYKSPDSAYFLSADVDDGIELSPGTYDSDATGVEADKAALDLYKVLNDYFVKEQRLVRIEQDQISSTLKSDDFQSETVFCSMSTGNGAVWISCADKSDLDKLSAELKPIANALNEQGKLNANTLLSPSSIEDSPVNGYKRTTVGISGVGGVGGYAAMLYKKDGESWKFFKGAQNGLKCEDYNVSDDVRNAFAGDGCYDGDAESTVKPASQS